MLRQLIPRTLRPKLTAWMIALIQAWSRRNLGDGPLIFENTLGERTEVFHRTRRVTSEIQKDGSVVFILHCYEAGNMRPLERVYRIDWRDIRKENGQWLARVNSKS